jgi:hypothetical protein
MLLHVMATMVQITEARVAVSARTFLPPRRAAPRGRFSSVVLLLLRSVNY